MPLIIVPPGPSMTPALVGEPTPGPTGSGTEAWDLSSVSPSWTVTHARSYYEDVHFNAASWDANNPFGVYVFPGQYIDWDAGGNAWIEANAGNPDAVDGTLDLSGAGTPTWGVQLTPDHLEITYEIC